MSIYTQAAVVAGLFSIVGLLLTMYLRPKSEVDLKIIISHIEEHFSRRHALFGQEISHRKEVSAKLHRLVQDIRTAQRAFERLARNVSIDDDDFVTDTASALQSLSPFLVTWSSADGVLLPSHHQEALRAARRQFTVLFLNLSVSKKEREKQATKERVMQTLKELSEDVASFEETVREFTGVDNLVSPLDAQGVCLESERLTSQPLKRTADAAA